MTDFKNVEQKDGCKPDTPAQPQATKDPCTGEIHGTVSMECCCPMLRTRTFIVSIGPQTEPQVAAYLQNTVNAYEGSGYMILAHSLVDVGAGWLLGLTVAWYA